MTRRLFTPSLSRRGLLRAFVRTLVGGSVSAFGVTVYGVRIEPEWLKLERVRVAIPGLPPAFENYRLALLTDLHVGPATHPTTISRAIRIALDLAPDLILLAGDYVTGSLNAPALYGHLRQLDAPDGVWAIMGNHDHWVDPQGVRQVLADAEIPELRNASTAIRRGDQALWLAGVDDIWEEQHDLEQALADVPSGAPLILLAHEPDFADQVVLTGRVSLQLSGHSHGGQIRIPGIGAPITPYLGRKYPYGLRRLGTMWLYTSRGVGQNTSIRINCRPEVTEITLVGG
ncbi:MAG TPA: metallophosphoesterase [Chloroflexi bacterium]|nr:metallophosphoesterase [Chloroflexota bacterium]